MHLAQFAGFNAVGLVVGTAGLVGIGGGVLMVPFLYFIYDSRGRGLGLRLRRHQPERRGTWSCRAPGCWRRVWG